MAQQISFVAANGDGVSGDIILNLFSVVANTNFYLESITLEGIIVTANPTAFIVGFAATKTGVPTFRLLQVDLIAANTSAGGVVTYRTPIFVPKATQFINAWMSAPILSTTTSMQAAITGYTLI